MKRILLALALSFLPSMALSHDEFDWIRSGKFLSPVDGSHCCGEQDCRFVPEEGVSEIKGGYMLRTGEFVPYAEVNPSRDGRFWRCHFPDGRRRCFFGPPMGS